MHGARNGCAQGAACSSGRLPPHSAASLLSDAAWGCCCARLLLTKKIHRLPVVDAEGKLVGVLSRGNIVKAALALRQQAAAAAAAASSSSSSGQQ